MRTACRAGCETIINEPTAPLWLMVWKTRKNRKWSCLKKHFILGGGTFDSPFWIAPKAWWKCFPQWRHPFGRRDFDKKVVDWIRDQFKKSDGIDLSEDARPCSASGEAAEKAKIELSGTKVQTQSAFHHCRCRWSQTPQSGSLPCRVHRLTSRSCDRSLGPCRLAMKDAKG